MRAESYDLLSMEACRLGILVGIVCETGKGPPVISCDGTPKSARRVFRRAG